jgi:hypothetical protein
MSGHPLLRLRMHMADGVRMCIDIGIGIDSAQRVTVANGLGLFMTDAYKAEPAAGWPRSAGAGRFGCD